MIFKSTKFLFSSLILTTSILTFNLPKISVNAGAGSEYMVVNHSNGINIRDKNCKVVDQVGHGEPLQFGNNNSINLTCNIGGENIKMLNYGAIFGNGITELKDQYVASKFVQKVNSGSNGTYTTQDKVRLNNPSGAGVNLRDNNCQRVITLPNGTYSENSMGLGGTIKICKTGGQFYVMTYFIHKGVVYSVAEVLTKYE